MQALGWRSFARRSRLVMRRSSAHGGFAVDEQAEALLERERLGQAVELELLGQRGGHAEALELVELVDDGMGEHGEVSPW